MQWTIFFKTFGHHVWFLSLAHDRNFTKEDELIFYKNLHRCLANVPNSKSLHFTQNFPIQPAEYGEAVKYMKDNPLPSMEHLDTLRLSGELIGGTKTVNALFLK